MTITNIHYGMGDKIMGKTENVGTGGGGVVSPALKNTCDGLRKSIQISANTVKVLMDSAEFSEEQGYAGQHGEMRANIMLTYRHLEDARMRIGKILQAADDGVSILDK